MQVYREILPRTYRLLLVDDQEPQPALALLREALQRAARSGKRSIRVESRLPRLDMGTLRLLARFRRRLRAAGIRLTLAPTIPPSATGN